MDERVGRVQVGPRLPIRIQMLDPSPDPTMRFGDALARDRP